LDQDQKDQDSEVVELALYESRRFAQTQNDVSLSDEEWTTVYVVDGDGNPFGSDSLIIRNNDGGIIYFRESPEGNIIPIDPGEIYETSLELRTDFQLMGENDDPDYKVIASVN